MVRILIAILLTAWTLWRLDGFFPAKIQGPLQMGKASHPSEEALGYLEQPYCYLAKGRQCFAFLSQDGKTVVKFFNYNRFSLPFPLNHLPFLKSLYQKRQSRFIPTMQSYEIANEYLQEETGLLYVHLQQGGGLPDLEIKDRGGGRHCIDLNKTAFVLQRFAKPIYEEFQERFQQSGQEGVEEAVQSFLMILHKRCALGIADDDRDVEINFGFCNETAMLLDPGRLFFDQGLQTKEGVEEEMRAATRKLRRYLKKNYPEVSLSP